MNDLGLVAGDAAGFPNGRRINDDVVTIEVRAVAGLTIPLVDPSYTPDDAASAVQDGTTNTNAAALDVVPLPWPAGRGVPDGARDHEGVVTASMPGSGTGNVEAHNAFAGQGAVLLDIGGDIGALIVTMPSSSEGLEVEIRPEGAVTHEHGHDHADGIHSTSTSTTMPTARTTRTSRS